MLKTTSNGQESIMKAEKDIAEKINQTLNSLEGLGKAEASPFFYSKLEARMQDELTSSIGRFAFVGNLKTSMAVLGVIMVLNVTSLFLLSGSDKESTTGGSDLDLISQDYFSDTDDYEYLNSY
ncbi:hypothetical protein BFP97_18095 [Roseivirga sp. 4D4]|uniref:hypothetical protein n=1 Tax=Roseivirga sp. 4D4 TaxID=1889784 RepID=UPI000852B1DB|nr:hypothetical protein [Roseivirga sp. 4D4]OEK03317.1 hypothetical protein BFP97_18095 [Roseivirga sp. 4D4]